MFIGKSCSNKTTGFDDDESWGNTILLQVDDKKYMFVGNTGIYTFQAED